MTSLHVSLSLLPSVSLPDSHFPIQMLIFVLLSCMFLVAQGKNRTDVWACSDIEKERKNLTKHDVTLNSRGEYFA